MKEYLRIPTHKRLGWLIPIGGIILTIITLSLLKTIFQFQDNYLIGLVFGGLLWVFLIALIIEIVATMLGKNKPIMKDSQ